MLTSVWLPRSFYGSCIKLSLLIIEIYGARTIPQNFHVRLYKSWTFFLEFFFIGRKYIYVHAFCICNEYKKIYMFSRKKVIKGKAVLLKNIYNKSCKRVLNNERLSLWHNFTSRIYNFVHSMEVIICNYYYLFYVLYH